MNGTSDISQSAVFDSDFGGVDALSGPPADYRATVALREFVRGNLPLRAAIEVAGLADHAFIDLLSTTDLAQFQVPGDTSFPEPASPQPPRISVIVPLHNEEGNIPVLHERLSAVLDQLGAHEILFVDDGSDDGSAHAVLELQRHDDSVKLIRLARNFGKEGAVAAGMDHARGQAVIVMDADLQDPPEVLPDLVAQWEAGFEVVYAVRRKRKESLWKRAGYHWFYRVMRLVSDVEMPLDAGDFGLMDRRVVDVVRRLPEKNRFMRGLRSWAGFRQTGVEYERPVRHSGDAKFTFRTLVKTAVDGLLAFSSAPLRMAVYLGFLTAAAGVLFLGVAVYQRLFAGYTPTGWTSLVAIVLTLGGVQLIVIGVVGAYIARIYDETKRRPTYLVEGTYDRQGAHRG